MRNWLEKNITDQTGKIALITGANSGIGYFTALELARAGATVILGCRNIIKAEAAKNSILKAVPGGKVLIEQIDLANLNAIKEFCKQFVEEGHSLDILVCNAGVMTPQERMTTSDGFELQWGTNYLGHFALTAGLMPSILKAEKGRVVIVSSIAYRGARIMFDDINAEKIYQPMNYYKQSKLAETIFGLALERKLRESQSRARCVICHPGISRTELLPNSHKLKSTFSSWLSKTITRLGMPADHGALSSIYAATSPMAQGGRLYAPDKLGGTRGFPCEEPLDEAVNVGSIKIDQLWKVSQEQTGMTMPL